MITKTTRNGRGEIISRVTLGGMAKSAAKEAVAWIKSGARATPPDVEAKRLLICAQCPHFNSTKSRCGKCGCFMRVKVKLNSAKCPIGSW